MLDHTWFINDDIIDVTKGVFEAIVDCLSQVDPWVYLDWLLATRCNQGALLGHLSLTAILSM